VKVQEMREYRGIALLILASLVVAIAIIADGQVARTVNGIGGLVWITSVVFLIRQLRTDSRFTALLAISATFALVLVLLMKPSDYLSAAVGFAIAGSVMGYVAKSHPLNWSATVPAFWLPIHLLVAISKVVVRAIRDQPGSVRTEPPPTSALVPFVMVFAALLGGFAIQFWQSREAARPPVQSERVVNSQ
jgi:hypothetical protein